jgi:uncharacterized protein YdbL (DUF1318 family)
MHPSLVRSVVAAAVLAALGCVTINLYFPEGEVKDLAQKIEDEVQQQAEVQPAEGEASQAPATEPETEVPPPSGGGSVGLLDSLFGISPAYAQGVPEPEVTNPAIRKIIDSRAARLAEVNRYKAQGVLGENNQGLVEVRNLDAVTDLRARAEVQKLVKAENTDREQLYREIAAEKNIDLSQLPKIQATYAETLRANARSGDWIQSPDGSWKQKGR